MLVQSWQTIGTFIDNPSVNKKELLALANAFKQLPSTKHTVLLDELGAPCASCIKSEVDLMCIIDAMNTVLTEPELLKFLQRLAEIVGEQYKQKRSVAILIPYIRVALQLEAIISDVSSAEQQEFVNQFLGTLFRHVDEEIYKKLNNIAQSWPMDVLTRWRKYVSKLNPRPKTNDFKEAGPPLILSSKIEKRSKRADILVITLISLLIPVLVIGIPVFVGNAREAGAITLPVPRGWKLVLDDPLRDNSKGNQWGEDSASGESPYSCQFVQGAYHAFLSRKGYFQWCLASATDFSNFAFQVQMKIITGDAGGVLFRANADKASCYYFFVSREAYSLVRYVHGNDNGSLVLDSGSNPVGNLVIRPRLGQVNQYYTLGVIANGDTIQVYINYMLVTSMRDSTFTHGQIAVIASDRSDPTEVVYSNAKVWTP